MSNQQEKRAKDEFSVSSELEAYVNNRLQTENEKVHEHMGLVPNAEGSEIQFMNFLASTYNPNMHPEMPQSFGNTKIGDLMKRNLATQVGTQAVKDGNISQMKYITGKQQYGFDASSIHTLRKLRDRMKQDAYIAYLFGHMGNGKSEFANLMGELASEELGYKVYSNVRSTYENGHSDGYIYTFGEYLKTLAGGEKVEELQDIQNSDIELPDQKILFIFDEGNQEASGYSDDAYETMNKMGKMLTLIRKVGGILIIIGHTGKDVHPHIRRLSNDCIHKTGKKTAKIYQDVQEAKGVDLKEEIKGIPKSNWNFDTLEISFWDWTLATQDELNDVQKKSLENNKKERNMSIFQDYHVGNDEYPDGMTQEQIADKYGFANRSRVSQIITEMEQRVEQYKEVSEE